MKDAESLLKELMLPPVDGVQKPCLEWLKGVQREAYNQGLTEASNIAKAHNGHAERDRRAKGLKLGQMTQECASSIRDEERGEDIASEMIAESILKARLRPHSHNDWVLGV